MDHEPALEAAARLIREADAILIGAGAGMGVDSGLPDFRGPQGFWRAYPALGRAGLSFYDVASPRTFETDPRLAWGFYGHRLRLYRNTVPHEGFAILRRLADAKPHGAFVFTSNVDGQFQKAGFAADRVCECHGSLHHLQCFAGCGGAVWRAARFEPEIDDAECRLLNALPACARCRALARPNVLMFGDWNWVSDRSDIQESRLHEWLREVDQLVVIELGAGTDVPSVRSFCERVRRPLVRINPREPQLGSSVKGVGLAMGALAALREIAARLQGAGGGHP